MPRVLVIYTEPTTRTALVTLDPRQDVEELLASSYGSARWKAAEIREAGSVVERFEREGRAWRGKA